MRKYLCYTHWYHNKISLKITSNSYKIGVGGYFVFLANIASSAQGNIQGNTLKFSVKPLVIS